MSRCGLESFAVEEIYSYVYYYYYYYLHVRVGVNHASMIHNFAYAEHDKQDYDRGKNELVVVVVVDFIILLGESQQALPFYWEP